MTPKNGKPIPVTKKPRFAQKISAPASCPIWTGNIRLPAPKNRPNSMEPMNRFSLNDNFFDIENSFTFLYFVKSNKLCDELQQFSENYRIL